MFERYNEDARRSIFFARYEASQFGAPCIEAEHLLLGLLRQMNLPAGAIRAEIVEMSPRSTPTSTSVDLPVSLAVKRTMAFAAEEATKLGHAHIGAEHLLIGLMVDDPDSRVPGLLQKHGIDRTFVLSRVAEPPVEEPVERESLRTLVDGLPGHLVQPAKKMLERMQNPLQIPPPPPFGMQGGWIGGGGGGAGRHFSKPGTWRTPPRPMRQGRHSRSRIEDGVEVVETRHLRDGCEITLIERFRLSEDGKTLTYTQEVTGPGKSEQHSIDFDIA